MDFERYVHAQCALLGLTLTPEQLPGVVRYLQLAAGVAPRVMDFALTPADEPGNVFIPVAIAAQDKTEAPAP
jgi:Protein of unknown function (DUF4089)